MLLPFGLKQSMRMQENTDGYLLEAIEKYLRQHAQRENLA